MKNQSVTLAEAYYKAMHAKNIKEIQKYLHQEVEFIGPLDEIHGKDALIETIERLLPHFKSLTIRQTFGCEDQAMLAYYVDFPEPIGRCRAAALLNFKENLIIRLELFYDARAFERMQKDIFATSHSK